jgi:hypothetical protein
MAALPATPPPAPVPEPAPLSQVARIVDVFIAPSKTFTDLRRSANWWAPFLLIAVVSLAFVYAVDKKVTFYKVAENQIQVSPKAAQRIDQMPADQRNQAISQQGKITRYFSYGSPVLALIWYLIIAGVLLLTFKFGAGADLTFKFTLAVVVYAALPLAVRSILATVTLWAGVAPDSFTFQNPLGSNPGFYLSPTDSPFLYNIASGLDVFMIWTLVLTAVGLSCVSKLKRSTALFGVFGWYVLMILVGAGIGALFS